MYQLLLVGVILVWRPEWRQMQSIFSQDVFINRPLFSMFPIHLKTDFCKNNLQCNFISENFVITSKIAAAYGHHCLTFGLHLSGQRRDTICSFKMWPDKSIYGFVKNNYSTTVSF